MYAYTSTWQGCRWWTWAAATGALCWRPPSTAFPPLATSSTTGLSSTRGLRETEHLWALSSTRLQAYRHGVHGLARFARADLWRVDLSRHDHIVIFGVSGMVWRVSVCHVLTLQMSELRGKVFGEMHAGAHVIACRFPFTEVRCFAQPA